MTTVWRSSRQQGAQEMSYAVFLVIQLPGAPANRQSRYDATSPAATGLSFPHSASSRHRETSRPYAG